MLKTILSTFCGIMLAYSSWSQTYDSYIGSIVANYSSDSILANLMQFEAFGCKSLGTAAQTNAKNWLINKYTSYGYTDITVQPFSYYGSSTANVIVKKVGCQYPDTYVIVDGHYDTKTGPGTNDNGTGTSIILEMARQLANVDTKYSILFIHFSGEEDGLIGSQYYVNNTVIPQNMDIKLLFNIDEVGGVSWLTNNTIVCEQDEGTPLGNNAQSSVVTNQLAVCTGLYSSLNTEISFAYASDYMPFEDNGEIITGFYEKNESPYPHTVNDVLANMDPGYVYEVGKAATGAMCFWAEAYDQTYLTIGACNSYTSPSGNYTWTASGTYTDTLYSIAGCDSILIIDLTLSPVDPGVTQNFHTLTSNESTASSYQWIDCNNGNAPLAGETGQSFTATVSGNYAVILTKNGCVDTSACTFVYVAAGLDEFGMDVFELYPNPAKDVVTIKGKDMSGPVKIAVTDLFGKAIIERTMQDAITELNVSSLSEGVYFFTASDETGLISRYRIVINR